MEQVIKHTVSSRRTDKYDNVKQNLISCSNAIYFIASPFNQLSISTKSFFRHQKKPVAITTDKNVFLKKNLQEQL